MEIFEPHQIVLSFCKLMHGNKKIYKNKAFFEKSPPVNGKKDQYKLKADIEDHRGNVSIEWKL